MKTNASRSTLLIEVPHSGSSSVATALKLTEEPVGRFALPVDARKNIAEEAWKSAKKIIIVRDVAARFESAAAFAVTNPEEMGDAADFFRSVAALPSNRRGAEILVWLKDLHDDARPIIFRQQSLWLTAKFDLVLSTSDIAGYFNASKLPTVFRSNTFSRNPKFIRVSVPQNGVFLREAYPDDFDTFARLLVWSPTPDKVRLVTGNCATCQKKLASENADPFLPLDLTEGGMLLSPPRPQTVGDSSEVAVFNPAPKSAKRSRSK
jgi:hypothetical protein